VRLRKDETRRRGYRRRHGTSPISQQEPAMKNALVNPVVLGVVAMFAITFAYVEVQPQNQTVATDDAFSLPVTAR
jgi:hypothetical protein